VSLGARAARPASRGAGSRGAGVRLRRGSLAALVLTVLEYGLGVYVNLYVSVPAADHGSDLGSAIANGPAVLSVHAVTGLLLGLAGLGVLVQAVMNRHRGVIAASAFGLLALALADVAGTGYASSGDASASMAMAVLTGAALLCYAANLYLLRRPPATTPYEDGGTTGPGKSRV
jgi:hypothetical protein